MTDADTKLLELLPVIQCSRLQIIIPKLIARIEALRGLRGGMFTALSVARHMAATGQGEPSGLRIVIQHLEQFAEALEADDRAAEDMLK